MYRLTKKRKNSTGIPNYELDTIARALLPAIQKFFEDEQTQKEFEEWQAERKIKLNNKKQKKEKEPHWDQWGCVNGEGLAVNPQTKTASPLQGF